MDTSSQEIRAMQYGSGDRPLRSHPAQMRLAPSAFEMGAPSVVKKEGESIAGKVSGQPAINHARMTNGFYRASDYGGQSHESTYPSSTYSARQHQRQPVFVPAAAMRPSRLSALPSKSTTTVAHDEAKMDAKKAPKKAPKQAPKKKDAKIDAKKDTPGLTPEEIEKLISATLPLLKEPQSQKPWLNKSKLASSISRNPMRTRFINHIEQDHRPLPSSSSSSATKPVEKEKEEQVDQGSSSVGGASSSPPPPARPGYHHQIRPQPPNDGAKRPDVASPFATVSHSVSRSGHTLKEYLGARNEKGKDQPLATHDGGGQHEGSKFINNNSSRGSSSSSSSDTGPLPRSSFIRKSGCPKREKDDDDVFGIPDTQHVAKATATAPSIQGGGSAPGSSGRSIAKYPTSAAARICPPPSKRLPPATALLYARQCTDAAAVATTTSTTQGPAVDRSSSGHTMSSPMPPPSLPPRDSSSKPHPTRQASSHDNNDEVVVVVATTDPPPPPSPPPAFPRPGDDAVESTQDSDSNADEIRRCRERKSHQAHQALHAAVLRHHRAIVFPASPGDMARYLRELNTDELLALSTKAQSELRERSRGSCSSSSSSSSSSSLLDGGVGVGGSSGDGTVAAAAAVAQDCGGIGVGGIGVGSIGSGRASKEKRKHNDDDDGDDDNDDAQKSNAGATVKHPEPHRQQQDEQQKKAKKQKSEQVAAIVASAATDTDTAASAVAAAMTMTPHAVSDTTKKNSPVLLGLRNQSQSRRELEATTHAAAKEEIIGDQPPPQEGKGTTAATNAVAAEQPPIKQPATMGEKADEMDWHYVKEECWMSSPQLRCGDVFEMVDVLECSS